MGGHSRLKPGLTIRASLAAALAWPGLAHAQAAIQTQANPQPSREEVTPPTPTTQPPAPTVSVDSRAALAQSSCPFENSPLRMALTSVKFTRPDGLAAAGADRRDADAGRHRDRRSADQGGVRHPRRRERRAAPRRLGRVGADSGAEHRGRRAAPAGDHRAHHRDPRARHAGAVSRGARGPAAAAARTRSASTRRTPNARCSSPATSPASTCSCRCARRARSRAT